MAATIGLAVTSQAEMNTIGKSAAGNGVDRVAGLVRALVDLEPLSAVLEHLRHERQALHATAFVKRAQNLFLTADFHPIASAKALSSLHLDISNSAEPVLDENQTVLDFSYRLIWFALANVLGSRSEQCPEKIRIEFHLSQQE